MVLRNNVLTAPNHSELLDMNPIVKTMGNNISGSSLRFSYSIPSYRKRNASGKFSSVVSVPTILSESASSGDYKTKALMREIQADMDASSTFTTLNEEEVRTCVDIFSNYSVINICVNEFKEKLFEVPFQIALRTESGKELAVLQDSVREIIVENYWMPFLKKHFEWKKVFGIVPIFFEPVGLREAIPEDYSSGKKTDGKKEKRGERLIIHYVPTIPNFDAGRIWTYCNKKGRRGFVWVWNKSTSDLDTEFVIPVSGFNDGGGDSSGRGNDVLSITKSAYFFMDVIKEPYASGYLSSDIKSLVNEWRNLRYMEEFRLVGASKMINPETIVEFHPDPASATSGDSLDMAKLQIDILRTVTSAAGGGNGARHYSAEFGQSVEETGKDIANALAADPKYGVSAYRKITEERAYMQNACPTVADVDLGFASPSDPRAKSTTASYGSSYTREKLELYSKNHPGCPVSNVLVAAMSGKTAGPTNARYLNPYETVSGSAPKSTMPEFDVMGAKERLDKLAAAVCDFPLEIIMNRTGRMGGDTETDGAYQFLKDRLAAESKIYQSLIKNLWSMSYLEFVENSRRKLDKMNKRMKNLEKIDINSVLMFEYFQVTFPRTPFESVAKLIEYYKMGLIDDMQFQKFMSDKTGIPEVDPSRIKEFKEKLEEYVSPEEEDPGMGTGDKQGSKSKKKKKRTESDDRKSSKPAKKHKKNE